MGLGHHKETSYVKIANGLFCIKADEATATHKFKDRDGNFHYYIADNCFTGTITAIDLKKAKDPSYENQWHITIVDHNGETAVLTVGYSNGAAENLFNCLANVAEKYEKIGWLKLVARANTSSDGKKTFTNLSINTGSEFVGWKYKNDELPATEKVIVNGKEQTDKTKRMQFWEIVLKNEIIPALRDDYTPAAARLGLPDETTTVQSTQGARGAQEAQSETATDESSALFTDEMPF